MQLQFNQSVIPCQNSIKREMQCQEQTQEVRINDGMPDIGRVLASWGQPVIRGKEWRSGNVGVSGGVMVWTLYEPEEGGEPQCVETWLPFQMKWDVPQTQQDGIAEVSPMLRSVDARLLTARKLMIRANIGVLGQMWEPTEITVYTPSELPEDVQVLQNVYPTQLPVEAGEKAFALDDVLSFPASAPGVSKVLRYCLQPTLMEKKIVTDKLVIRGVGMLSVLYLGMDGKLHTWEFELPFSQYTQLQKEYESCADARIRFAVTALELEQGEEETWNLKAGITAQYVVYDCVKVQLAEDMYSTCRHVDLQIDQLQTSALLDVFSHTIQAECSPNDSYVDVVDGAFYPDQPRLIREGDRVVAELSGVFHVLCYDESGMLQGSTMHWENEWQMDAAPEAAVEMLAQSAGKVQATAGMDMLHMRCDLNLQVQTNGTAGMPMLTGATLGEQLSNTAERPSVILCRAGDDSLWEIAKRSGSTVDKIRMVNAIEQEPDSEQMLLIPLS